MEKQITRTDCWECMYAKFERDNNILSCKWNLDQSIPICCKYKTDDDGGL